MRIDPAFVDLGCEKDKKAVSSFYDRGYIAERLKGLETELALECRITLNGEERWVRNVIIRGEIEDSEYAMIFLRDITETKVESARHLQMAADNASMEQLIQSIVRLVDRFVVCDLENDRYEFYNLNGQMIYKPYGKTKKRTMGLFIKIHRLMKFFIQNGCLMKMYWF